MSASFITAAENITGKSHTITDPSLMAPYCQGFRYGEGKALAVILPKTLLEMWQIAKLCVEHDLIIIPQAANTGLTGGSSPDGDYERPVVILSTKYLKGIRLIKENQQAVALAGASLFELEDLLRDCHREPHSVIGSSCIGASIVGGICNNSGGALIQRGPAYTEFSLYARLNEQGELTLHNELGINLGTSPEEILNNLEQGNYQEEDIIYDTRRASDHDYQARVRDINSPIPSRYNNDGRRLYGASGSAGKLIVFAVRIDTFAKAEREQVFYIATNDPTQLSDMRRHILKNFQHLPISGEYIHRDFFALAEKYGRDTYRVIHHLGSAYIPKIFALKNRIDRLAKKSKILPKNFADKSAQFLSALLPKHLPKFMYDYHARYEHHLILKMSDVGIEEAKNYLNDYFKTRPGEYRACNQKEGEAAILHRFACGGAAVRYRLIHHKKVGEFLSLDIALPRNAETFVEKLPEDIEALIDKKLYCGHFFCHVMHHDYILKKGVDSKALKEKMLQYLDQIGAAYPAEHNVGHQYKAHEPLRHFYQQQDPTNRLNPGIGKTSRKKYWQ